MHGDLPFAERCKREAGKLSRNIEENGWDGEWYLRAFFDDGTPLGSAKQSRMPDRFHCAKLVCPVRGRECRTLTHGNGRSG